MPWPIGKQAAHNKVNTISNELLRQIKMLRLNKHLSYAKIADELNLSKCFVFKVVKKYCGLQTHRKFDKWSQK